MIHQKILRVMACAVTVWTLCACGASKTQTDGAQQEKTPAAYAWVADSLKNFTVLDVRETGPRSAKMGVRLDFNNPMSLAFELSQLHAHLLVDGQPCFEITSPGTLIISRKARETYLAEEEAFNRTMAQWNGAVEQYRAAHPDAPWNEIEEACGKCPWLSAVICSASAYMQYAAKMPIAGAPRTSRRWIASYISSAIRTRFSTYSPGSFV